MKKNRKRETGCKGAVGKGIKRNCRQFQGVCVGFLSPLKVILK